MNPNPLPEPAQRQTNPTRRRAPRQPARHIITAVVGLIAVAGGSLLALAPAVSASAATVSAITAVSIVAPDSADPSAPLTVGEQFKVDADWTLPAGARPGDTFTVTFPSPVSGYSSEFTLLDATGAGVGTCAVTSTSLSCTVGAYVATHSNVTGSLYFHATAAQTTDGPVLFTTSAGTTFTVPVPGGAIGPGTPGGDWPVPTSLGKGGWQNADGSLGWDIFVPGSLLLTGGKEVTLTDTFDSRLTFDPSSLTVGYVNAADWNNGDWSGSFHDLTAGTGADTYTFAAGATPSSFLVTIHQPVADRIYGLYYTLAAPAGTADGTHFDNTVSGEGAGDASASVDYVAAGGSASGDALRAISVTKMLAGSGPAPTGTYPFTVSCTNPQGAAIAGFPAQASLAAGQTQVFPGIPVGSNCTVDETNNRGADAVAYAPARSVTVTAGSPATIAVVVTNTFELHATPTTPATPPAAPSGSSTPGGADGSPSTDALARTGSDVALPGLVALGALALVAVGAILGWTRRRTATGRR
ncbi:DUF5979 domain-containing protein [Leifsonia poae]|uniref:DUF5979 domain-containing protein n=1 Tax=Leifsonia poae TaxID=110933 RepID=UPI001CBE2AC8|nr:DUF5979 domain-containing protein [Leifsonia poae]